MRSTQPRQYVFGPVASRRLGRSLGIDLVPPKTCCYDCVYCQLGRTTNQTIERAEYVPTDEVVRQVHQKLEQIALPDYLTLSGSGEPTLHSRLGEIVQTLKGQFNVPVAILTSGALLWDPEVRRQCALADLVMPSLDAGDEMLFQYVNRPHTDLSFLRVVEGLTAFRREYEGPIWLEVLLLAGVTDFEPEVDAIRACVDRIAPDRIQVNTVVRPPAEEYAFRVEDERLADLAVRLGATAEVIPDRMDVTRQEPARANLEDILAYLARRPGSIEEIARGLGVSAADVAKRIASLHASGVIRVARTGRSLLFALAGAKGR